MTMDLHDYQLVPIFLLAWLWFWVRLSSTLAVTRLPIKEVTRYLPWRARFSVYWH